MFEGELSATLRRFRAWLTMGSTKMRCAPQLQRSSAMAECLIDGVDDEDDDDDDEDGAGIVTSTDFEAESLAMFVS